MCLPPTPWRVLLEILDTPSGESEPWKMYHHQNSSLMEESVVCNKSLEMIWKQCTTDRSAGWKCVQLKQK